MAETVLTGGCECGDIRYRVTQAPSWAGHCHCGMCRRMSGAAFTTWFTVPLAAVTWEASEPVRFRASEVAERGHCGTCGAQIFWHGRHDPTSIDLTVATLSDPGAVRATLHVYWDDRMPGIELADKLPKYRQNHRDSPLAED